MSQNSKWSSWQQLKPTKQETIIIETPITETIDLSTLVSEPVVETEPEPETTTEEVAPKPAKKRNVNV